ncbi:MAG: ATPase [Actinobacteria bacterium]|nr:MAG: ATPase [Actinomycetota bacterium]
MKRPAILAVDGGGSKVDAALLDRAGHVLGAARVSRSGKDLRAWQDGEGRTLDGLDAAVASLRARAGLDPDERALADLGVYCLAGADFPADDRRITSLLKPRGWARENVVRNDGFAVLRAGTDRGWGVGVVCGHGVNCVGIAPDGRPFRFPALGTISGDWGGGSDIGPAGLWYAVRAHDGRGEPTSLARLVPEHFGLKHPGQVVEAIHFGRIREDRVEELTPLVFRAAIDGDAVARSIVDRQADEIVAMAGAAMRRLRITGLDVDVVLGGGIFRNRDRGFFERMEQGLRAEAPGARIIRLAAPPVVGSALLGLDRLGGGPAAAARARAELTDESLTMRSSATMKGQR